MGQQDYSNDVVLLGGGLTLAFDLSTNPSTGWMYYDVPFDETNTLWVNTATEVRPTPEETLIVLSSPRQIAIRGYYRYHDATGEVAGLDDVVLDLAGDELGIVQEQRARLCRLAGLRAYRLADLPAGRCIQP
ncbi:MAG: hypothetical protein JXQ75_11070 [Phycisphaerae bacterium]|nr:hypothetical protein [Phycisphaerae bacterium]